MHHWSMSESTLISDLNRLYLVLSDTTWFFKIDIYIITCYKSKPECGILLSFFVYMWCMQEKLNK